MMTDIKYDPEYPFVFRDPFGGPAVAKFKNEEDAGIFQERIGVGEVVDTTPKPKIPEDANYIFVEDNDQSVFAYRIVFPDGTNGWMTVGGGAMTEEELLDYIGDVLVVVMIEKENA